MLKALVFDFDGVIVDSEPLHYQALLRIARGFGVEFDYDHYLAAYVGYDDRDAFRVMLAPRGRPGRRVRPEDWRGDERELAELVRRKGLAFAEIVAGGVTPIPGVQALVAQAAGQLPLAIASGATRQDIALILGGVGLEGKFDPIITADLVERSKPDPQTYALAVAGLARRHPDARLTPPDCLAIEDTAAGIESARGAGLPVLGLATSTPAAQLHRAHRVVASLEGVTVERLREWFG